MIPSPRLLNRMPEKRIQVIPREIPAILILDKRKPDEITRASTIIVCAVPSEKNSDFNHSILKNLGKN